MAMVHVLKSLNEGELVEFYTNPANTEEFHVGIMIACTNHHCAMLMISPFGLFDGFRLDTIDNILNIQTGTRYLEAIRLLMQYHQTKLPQPPFALDALPVSMLAAAKERGHIVGVEVLSSGNADGQGYVESISDGVCQIHQVDQYGFDCGTGFLNITDMTRIEFQSEDQLKLEIIREQRVKNETRI